MAGFLGGQLLTHLVDLELQSFELLLIIVELIQGAFLFRLRLRQQVLKVRVRALKPRQFRLDL